MDELVTKLNELYGTITTVQEDLRKCLVPDSGFEDDIELVAVEVEHAKLVLGKVINELAKIVE